MKRCLILAVACLIASACQGQHRTTSDVLSSDQVVMSHDVDPATGKLIAWRMVRGEGTPKGEVMPVLVESDYALFIYWPNEEYSPNSADKRVFIFYNNAKSTSYRTSDFSAFLQIVAAQPADIDLFQLETCSVPRDYMPEAQREQLERVLAEGNRRWGVNPVTGSRHVRTCYCETTGKFFYPGQMP